MAELLEHRLREGRPAAAVSPYRLRISAANDNVAPVRHVLRQLALAASVFAATFGIAWWWLN